MYANNSYCLRRSHVISLAISHKFFEFGSRPNSELKEFKFDCKITCNCFQSNQNKIGTETNFIVKEETKNLFYSWWMKTVVHSK